MIGTPTDLKTILHRRKDEKRTFCCIHPMQEIGTRKRLERKGGGREKTEREERWNERAKSFPVPKAYTQQGGQVCHPAFMIESSTQLTVPWS